MLPALSIIDCQPPFLQSSFTGTLSATTTLSIAGPNTPSVVLTKLSVVVALVARNVYDADVQFMFVRSLPRAVTS